jgi:hypothetical protein
MPPALLLVLALGCSSTLDCSSVGCEAPPVLVKTAKTYPTGSLAELCGLGSRCLTVPVGEMARESSGVPLTKQPTLDKRWFRKDIVRSTTNVRILSSQGDVLAEGAASVVQVHECCAGSEVTFDG